MHIVYICRHGQTEFNKQRRLMGWIDTPLTPEGEQNARDVAAKLKDISFDNITQATWAGHSQPPTSLPAR